MLRTLTAVCLAATLAACASTGHGGGGSAASVAVTPTQIYPLTAVRAPDEILLAPHANGLSAAQVVALTDLVARWRDAEAKMLVIKAPTAGGEPAYRMIEAVRARLEYEGVRPDAIQLAGYESQVGGGGPIVIGFERYKAVVPQCGRNWDSLTHTINNEVDPNFGCAVTANLAAMIANPEDIVHPQTMTPPDAARRQAVLEKYRAGENSSAQADPQAQAAISDAIQ